MSDKKLCTKCGVKQPRDDFHKDGLRKDGLSTRCKTCYRIYSKRYIVDNKEIIAIRQKSYQEKNKEAISLRSQKHRQANKELYARRDRRRRQANPEKVRAKGRRSSQARRARERSLIYSWSEKDSGNALVYWNGCCVYCGCELNDTVKKLHFDHFIPASYLGNDNPGTVRWNLVPCCQPCNNSKFNKDARKWLLEHYSQKEVEDILLRIQEYFCTIITLR